jgi:hypothetical protein
VYFGQTKRTAKYMLGLSQEPTCGCRKRARRSAPCFRPVLYRELCNPSACRGYGNRIPTDHFCAPVCIGRDEMWASEEATASGETGVNSSD